MIHAPRELSRLGGPKCLYQEKLSRLPGLPYLLKWDNWSTELSRPPRQIGDIHINGSFTFSRTQEKVDRVTRGEGCLGYPRPYKWASIFQMNGRKAKPSQFIFTELFFDVAVDLVLSGELLIRSHSRSRRKALLNKTLPKYNSFHSLLAESQEHYGLWGAIPSLFASLPKLNIPAWRHTYIECWQRVVNIPNVSHRWNRTSRDRLRIGLPCGRSWVRLRPDQHSGS